MVARAAHPHAQGEHEHRVQDDVDHRAQGHGDHAGTGKALTVDEGVHAQGHHHEQAAQQVYGDVLVGVGVDLGGSAEPIQGRPLNGQGQDGDAHPQGQQEGHGAAHDLFRAIDIPFPPGDGAQGRAAHARQHGEGGHDHDEGEGDAHPRQGVGPDIRQAADVHLVHHRVQGVDDLGADHGQGQPHHRLGNTALGKIVFALHGATPFLRYLSAVSAD